MKKFNIAYHVMIALKGLVRVLFGAINAGLISLAVYALVQVPGEAGYTAVGEFVGSVCLLVIAGALTYLLGCGFPFMGKKYVA